MKARNRRRVGWFTPEGAILRGKKTGGWAPLRRQRLDVWIWFARFLRTRAACAALVRTGHVRINGRRVNAPGTPLRKGDILTLALPGRTIVVNVVDFAERRGDAQAASHLYLPVPGMILPLLAKHLLPPVDEAAHLSPFIADDDADGQMRLRKQRVESRSRRIWPLKRGECEMTYVVTENCIKCKYMDCVEVCPVDCFYEGENMLVIHPDECIDCGVCEPECPAEAIKPDTEPGLESWLKLNLDYAKSWPNITIKRDSPPMAKDFDGKPGKLAAFFSSNPGEGD